MYYGASVYQAPLYDTSDLCDTSLPYFANSLHCFIAFRRQMHFSNLWQHFIYILSIKKLNLNNCRYIANIAISLWLPTG